MAVFRCSLHGSFPASWAYSDCPVCGEKCARFNNTDFDEDLDDLGQRIAFLREQWRKADADDAPIEDIPVLSDVRVRFDTETDQYWLHAWDMYPAVKHRLRDTDLVQIGKQVFEILGYVDDKREYYARPFSMTLSDLDLQKLARG
jgi:hypothetical protein